MTVGELFYISVENLKGTRSLAFTALPPTFAGSNRQLFAALIVGASNSGCVDFCTFAEITLPFRSKTRSMLTIPLAYTGRFRLAILSCLGEKAANEF